MSREQAKRSVRERDRCCARCGMTNPESLARWGRGLEVHRVTPGSPYTPEGCSLRCRSCHAAEPKRPAGQTPLARLRCAAGVSQSQMAAAAGVPLGTYRNWEQDRRLPRLDTAALLAKALGITLQELGNALVVDNPRN
jgi:DNA-binding XRE family transcriptional regulator